MLNNAYYAAGGTDTMTPAAAAAIWNKVNISHGGSFLSTITTPLRNAIEVGIAVPLSAATLGAVGPQLVAKSVSADTKNIGVGVDVAAAVVGAGVLLAGGAATATATTEASSAVADTSAATGFTAPSVGSSVEAAFSPVADTSIATGSGGASLVDTSVMTTADVNGAAASTLATTGSDATGGLLATAESAAPAATTALDVTGGLATAAGIAGTAKQLGLIKSSTPSSSPVGASALKQTSSLTPLMLAGMAIAAKLAFF